MPTIYSTFSGHLISLISLQYWLSFTNFSLGLH